MRPPEFLLFQADALRIPLADKSVHACVTSPPYYNLRSYETAKWIGGDPACDHQAPIEGGKSGNKGQYQRHAGRFAGPACYRCGAQRIDRQIGLEKSPSDYVAALVAAFAEVHRVLRDDGMLWVNISGSYAGGGGGNYGNGKSVRSQGGQQITNVRNRPKWLTNAGMKPKDLIYIPAMLALELQKWGWYLRSGR
jgi:DNA modification methylase